MFEAASVTPEEAVKLEGQVRLSEDRSKLLQSCQALDGCKCGVYENRPAACRSFRCFMLSSLEAGTMSESEAREGVEEAMSRRNAVAEAMGIDDPRRALALARQQAAAGTSSPEVNRALQRLKQLALLMLLPAAK
jgi:uncharacterized protein